MAYIDAALEQQVLNVRSDSGKRTYISTTSRIASGDELNRLNGEGGFALERRIMPAR